MSLENEMTDSVPFALASLAQVQVDADLAEEFGWLNAIEYAMQQHTPVECGVTHHFLPGHYVRQITMPAGALVVSKIHSTYHPFTITKGFVSEYNELTGQVRHLRVGGEGQHFATLTAPGTRRLLYCHEETVWTTMHPTGFTTVAEVEKSILAPNTNPLLNITPCPGS